MQALREAKRVSGGNILYQETLQLPTGPNNSINCIEMVGDLVAVAGNDGLVRLARDG